MRRQRFILTAVLLMAILSPTVAHSLIYLNLDIRLYKDGSAKVTEKRTCMIDDEGTEGYITMLNMGDIGIYNLSVKDERGVEFLCEQGNWDTKRSRREKTYRCGIHQINGGVELCWGIGKAGMRTYEISYTLTNLVKAYTDYDGFNHSFYEVDNTPAQAASLTITLDGDSLHRPTSRVWAFGFPGRVMLDNGQMCRCGKIGCLETGASGSALVRQIGEKLSAGRASSLAATYKSEGRVNLNDIFTAINSEDILAIEMVEKLGTSLGKGLAGLINIFNPELVVIGGKVAVAAGDYLMLPIRTAIKRHVLNIANRDTSIKLTQLKEQAAPYGASLLVRSRMLGML